MQQTNTNLVLFSYSSRGATYPFFSDFNFNLNTSHKSLDFLFSIDDLDNHTQALQCDILFLEENATISDAIIKTLENTDNIYLIFNNSSGHVQDRLQKISKGKIFRKIISDDLEKEISISLIELMAKAFKERNKNKYNATYSQLKQLFNYDLIMETKLKLLQSSSNPSQSNPDPFFPIRTPPPPDNSSPNPNKSRKMWFVLEVHYPSSWPHSWKTNSTVQSR